MFEGFNANGQQVPGRPARTTGDTTVGGRATAVTSQIDGSANRTPRRGGVPFAVPSNRNDNPTTNRRQSGTG